MVEYISAKGSKRLAIVRRRSSGGTVEAVNDARLTFTIPTSRVSIHIPGKFEFGDLLRLQEMLDDLRPNQVERIWEDLVEQGAPLDEDTSAGSPESLGEQIARLERGPPSRRRISANAVSSKVFGAVDAIRLYATHRLMATVGNVFFEPENGRGGAVLDGGPANTTVGSSSSSSSSGSGSGPEFYTALSPASVQANLRDRSALREFKQRYRKAVEARATGRRPASLHDDAGAVNSSNSSGNSAASSGGSSSSSSNGDGGGASMSAALAAAGSPEPAAADLPERVLTALDAYTEGLKQLVIKTHPWVVNGWARRLPDDRLAAKGRELLDFLEMAPTVKNAKKVPPRSALQDTHRGHPTPSN